MGPRRRSRDTRATSSGAQRPAALRGGSCRREPSGDRVRGWHGSHVSDVWRAKEGKSGGHGSGAWVGCVALDKAENWAAMGCGGGCITMWACAAGACASRVPTAAPPQALRLTGQHVMAAGAEPAVYRWNLAGEQISRQPCTPKSVFALDVQPRGGLTAVGGAGASVDLFSELGTRVTTLRCL